MRLRKTSKSDCDFLSPLQDEYGSDQAKNDEEDEEEEEYGERGDDDDEGTSHRTMSRSRSGRRVTRVTYREDDEDDEDELDRPVQRKKERTSRKLGGFVVEDDEEDEEAEYGSSKKRSGRLRRGDSSRKVDNLHALAAKAKQRNGHYADVQDPTSGLDSHDEDGRGYTFRERKKVNYSLVAPPGEPVRDGFGRKVSSRTSRVEKSGSRYDLDGMNSLPAMPNLPGVVSRRKTDGWNGLPATMSGRDYDKIFGDDRADSSDEDIPASRKNGATAPAFFGGGASSGLLGAGGVGGGTGVAAPAAGADLGAHRDAMGRMKGTDALADIDPLGVNMQIDFKSVGGLDQHIQQLKEMVSLPLLYPEVFHRFKVTPPRGVLFHGPPGTGKTLVARALAASCSSSGQQISFFMRKGADCLSKWVGEAERQLRLLFEEARASQPSIIFFDEIDGLAPVRSSKQDQIHASIVSTLLALMDGMDGRGQVVVIGATNRPDSVDPALRRPGRFDREFYFPLPNREARKSIINIHTKEWEPPLDEDFKDRLSEVTKGYGGADLRALCTEAALNAIQRRYPQIYQTTERLQLNPETIKVDAKDFMMSVNKVVPSSARSSSSAAAPLAAHLKPLLGETVDGVIKALERVMPSASKRNPLEEALWEEEETSGSGDAGFGREMMLQSFEQLRVFRPRLLIHGKRDMGQRYTGSALLHHLEGYHVQSLDVATLMGDSTTTAEAIVVQAFTEAKRHKPSVLFIPGLAQWANHVSESVRSTVKSLLDGLSPSDPITLLAICDEPFSKLPRDIRSWFGYLRDNRVEIESPRLHHRQAYFEEVLRYVMKPPNEFPDALPKRRRILEKLPIAPPRPPRVPTAAELRQQAADDARLLEHLKFRLGPILGELKKKYPRFKRDVWQEYNLYALTDQFEYKKEKNKVIVTLRYEPDSDFVRRLRANSPVENGENGVLGSQNISRVASRGGSADATLRTNSPAGSISTPLLGAPIEAFASNTEQHPDEGDVTMTNGDSNHYNGTTLDASRSFVIARDEPSSSATVSGLPVPATSASPPAEPPSVNVHPPAVSAEAEPFYLQGYSRDETGFYQRDLNIWTVSLERMQKRLYYNGYLTVNDFLNDIGKIVSNAIEAQEVDTERLTRAHQLHNLAVILLDQYIEAEFRISCDRMAERMIQREAEASKEEEKVRIQTEEEAKKPRMPSGERHSARLHGEAAEVGTLSDLAAIERKRSRKASEEDAAINGITSASAIEGESLTKRSRVDSNSIDMNGEQLAVPGAISTSAQHMEAKAIPTHLSPQKNAHSNHFPPYAQVSSIASPIIHASTPPSQATPLAVHPPFLADQTRLDRLLSHLLQKTSQFNVEQLEQLRAALFDAIWQRRKDWNRDSLIKEMQQILVDISDEVEADRIDAEREEEQEHL